MTNNPPAPVVMMKLPSPICHYCDKPAEVLSTTKGPAGVVVQLGLCLECFNEGLDTVIFHATPGIIVVDMAP